MPMEFTNLMLVVIFAVFMLAGFIKGTIGMGLPTVAIGLLVTQMTPAHAISVVIVPAILTNIWQTFGGPYLKDILRRLWPLLLGTAFMMWAAADLLTGPYAPYGTILLGILLIIYAIIGLSHVHFTVSPKNEKWLGGVMGLISGTIAAATGVQVIPAMPFMQSIGLERDELIQALGVYFMTATVGMLFNLSQAGFMTASLVTPVAVGLVAAFLGMYLGQLLRQRMDAATFRRWFLVSMILLGAYLAIDKLIALHLI